MTFRHILKKSHATIEQQSNKNNTSSVDLKPGDYVYITNEYTGPAKKLKNVFAGPYIVDSIHSKHMIFLKDPTGQKKFTNPVHTDRLKVAYVRQPTKNKFFSVTHKQCFATSATQTESAGEIFPINDAQPPVPPDFNVKLTVPNTDNTENSILKTNIPDLPVVSRPKRNIQRPIRFRESDHVDPNDLELVENARPSKTKRVLAQRHTTQGVQYLIQIVGEPAQNAKWFMPDELDTKANNLISNRPPPVV